MEKTRSAGLEELGVTAEGLKQMTLERATEGEAEAGEREARQRTEPLRGPEVGVGGAGRRPEQGEGTRDETARPAGHPVTVPRSPARGRAGA